jgi:hypothetical protein
MTTQTKTTPEYEAGRDKFYEREPYDAEASDEWRRGWHAAQQEQEQEREATIEAGKRALRQQYHEFCRGCAKEMLSEAQEQFEDLDEAEEWIQERIHETADGCYWVIYTHATLDTMMASDNWLAIDDMGMLTQRVHLGSRR